ncbi:c6 zinc finger domain containing protein [Grosmannia clavigera kw1407]|uniref:C6 zinc finger domain containing protein n=1 Tax=Grosmannia clavigera (strain kw1407 / UAMH 11150) TaxID=655863 RepID=F0XCM0_GROCL|nr:c6 zinc finger domain containing protein [Grosmannia clavigera kw1407]EFX04335.1 c6 zinc finger domain containing protein [Grosmannia clavigera kw1407]
MWEVTNANGSIAADHLRPVLVVCTVSADCVESIRPETNDTCACSEKSLIREEASAHTQPWAIMSLNSAGAGGGSGASNSHKRQSKSCKRCLKRKKRCYGFPICTNCERANEPCEQSAFAVQLHQRDDNYAAMQRIRALEAQLESAHAELASMRRSQRAPSPASSRPASHTPTEGQPSRSQTAEPSPSPESIADRPPLLPLEHIVQVSVWRKLLPSAIDKTPEHSVDLPTDTAGFGLVQAYLDHVHTRYPILTLSDLLQLHAQRHDIVDPAGWTDPVAELNTFRLYMVYAIGGAQQYKEQQVSEDYYEAALPRLWALQQLPPLAGVEALLLLLLYGLHSRPVSSTAVWQVAGLAMRICVDLGLHREASYSSSPDEQSRTRRLFWTAFCLDYSVALWLRRPLSLTRHDMDTRPPSLQENSANLTREEDTDLVAWARFVQLRQLEAHIYTDMYALDESLEMRFSKVHPYLEALDAWMHELQAPATSSTNKTATVNDDFWLQWNKAILVLLRPFLLVMHPDDDNDPDSLVARCLQAAGHVCSAAKHMLQRGLHSHALVTAHAAFNAGITICCCLYISPRLWSSAVVNDLRACSSTMLAMAERLPLLRNDCSVLEDAIGGVMDSLSRTTTGRTRSRRQARHLAEPDILAVQSLMKLSAQPDLVTVATAEPLDNALSALQLRSHNRDAEDQDRLQNLIGLITPEYPAC